jgi:hypothetical protein
MKKIVSFLTILLLLIECPIFSQPCENNVFKPTPRYFKAAYYPYIKRDVYENNKTRFIIAKEGDTYAKIAMEINVSEYELREFNDVTDFKLEPCEGEAVYLHYKQKKSKVQFHIVKDGESVRGISQRYAIKLKTLYKNNIKKGIMLHLLRPGDRICITCK